MFVRLLIAIALLGSIARADAPQQDPSFVLAIDPPVGGKADKHKLLTDALRADEAELKPALLAKTKAHPASRLHATLKLQVADKGAIKATAIDVSYRTASGPVKDDTIKLVIEEGLKKTKILPKDLIGATVEVTITILQP